MSKFVKIHQLNITKITKTGYKKRLVKIYRSLSKEGNEKQRKYKSERYKNLSADEKQRLVGYRKNYCKARKNVYFMK